MPLAFRADAKRVMHNAYEPLVVERLQEKGKHAGLRHRGFSRRVFLTGDENDPGMR